MNKKALYEMIMKSVAKEVKRTLNENQNENDAIYIFTAVDGSEDGQSTTLIQNIMVFKSHDEVIKYFTENNFGNGNYQLFDIDEQVRYDSTEGMDEDEIQELIDTLSPDQIIYVNDEPAYIKWEDSDVSFDYIDDMIGQFVVFKDYLN